MANHAPPESPPRLHASGTRPILTRFLSRHLWSPTAPTTLGDAVGGQRRSYDRATVIVRAFYAISIYWVITATKGWPAYARLPRATTLWPGTWWFDWFSVRTSVHIIFCFYLAAAVLVVLAPQQRLLRLAYAFGLLQYMAFVNSFDKINHDMHGWLFVSIVLVLLPTGHWRRPRRVADRQFFLTVVWTATLVVLLFYSLTGFWKVDAVVHALAHGRMSGIDFAGFSYIVGARIVLTNQDTLLGHFFTFHELPGWFLFTGTMYLETASIIIAFRPRLHRVWGLALILFHLGTLLAMGFTFGPNIVLVGLLLVCSPFTPDHIDVKAAVLDLPILHFASRRVASLRGRSRARPRPTADIEPTPSTA